MYQYIKNALGQDQTDIVKRIADGASIPVGMAQRDSLLYAEWLAQGNSPDPADEAL